MQHLSPIIKVFRILDTATEIISFLHPNEMLPVAMSCKNLLNAMRRIAGNHITTDASLFAKNITLAKWALTEMGCKFSFLCFGAAKFDQLIVMKWLQMTADDGTVFD